MSDADEGVCAADRRTFLGGLGALGGAAAGGALFGGSALAQQSSGPARQMENLDRGLVAVQTDAGVLVRWRLLGTDPNGIAFNLYRDGTQVNDSPITSATNYVDSGGSTGSTYRVRPVTDGTEGEASKPADVWQDNVRDIPINTPEGYHPNDCSVGDLTGNGRYDVVVKMIEQQYDNTHEGTHEPVLFDAYTLEGEHLWRIDLGINVRAGAHYNPYLVYDFDGDGIAELVVRTGDGTTDAAGNVIGDPNADWRDSNGRILEGPEYLTVFDGETGEELATTDFRPPRGNVTDWGDDYGNRVDRFLAGVAYLDGERPSIVQGRGYYNKTMLTAFDYRDGQLTQRWEFDSTDPGNGAYEGQGNHQLSIADVDGDGRDEIVYGACVIDDDGTGLYSTGWNHGDALHCGDLLPDRDGLEVFQPHEWGTWGATMRDAGTGEMIWGVESGNDVGRGVAANIDPNYRGAEAWAASGIGLREGPSGDWITEAPGSMNHLVWWTGDLQRETLDGWGGEGVIRKWDPANQWGYEVARFPDGRTNNGTKKNPCLTADILGDWREEVIWRRADDQALQLCVTPHETDQRLHTLMHDSQYRTAIAWQNVGYNQPPHPSFYIGAGLDGSRRPNVDPVGSTGEPTDTATPTATATPTPCEPTTITPYLRVDGGSWQNTTSVTIESGSSVEFGPQPVSGGSWSWSGPSLSASSREVTVSPSSTSTTTYTATYTNDCGETSTQAFTVTVESAATPTPTDPGCDAPSAPAWSDGTTPYDVDGDGVHEDLNGNCEFDSDDVVTYFQEIDRDEIQSNPGYYDANGNGNADFDDIVTLFQSL